MSTWIQIGLWALVVAATFQTLFVLVYATRPWYTHYVGRALFAKSSALCVTLWVVVANDFHFIHTVVPQVLCLCAVAITIVGQCVALFVQVAHDEHDKHAHGATVQVKGRGDASSS